MPKDRYYIDDGLKPDETVTIEGAEFHHLAHVMRGQLQDEVELVNGNGILAKAVITSLDKKRASLHVSEVFFEEKPLKQLILIQALPRNQKLDWILEKGTELGMTELILFPGELGEKRAITDENLIKWQTACIPALKQCGRLYLPKITSLPPLKKWSGLLTQTFFGDTSPKSPSLISLALKTADQKIAFIVGPESGFSKEEEHILKNLGATGVSLSKNILRTETAAIAALAILQAT